MAVTILDAWSVEATSYPHGENAPASSAGTNRLKVLSWQWEITLAFGPLGVTGVSMGGVPATGFEVRENQDETYNAALFAWWNDDAIEAMSGTAISITRTAATTPQQNSWSVATYQNVPKQVSPIKTVSQDPGYVTLANSCDIDTTSAPGDRILASVARASANRDVTAVDTLTQVYQNNTSGSFTRVLAEGDGGDDLTTFTGDGISDDWTFLAIVLDQAPSSGGATGSAAFATPGAQLGATGTAGAAALIVTSATDPITPGATGTIVGTFPNGVSSITLGGQACTIGTVTGTTAEFTVAAQTSLAVKYGPQPLVVGDGLTTDSVNITLTPPSGYTQFTAAGFPYPSESLFTGASPAVADGDQAEGETVTSLGASVTWSANGSAVVDANSGQHLLDLRVWDESAGEWGAFATYEIVPGTSGSAAFATPAVELQASGLAFQVVTGTGTFTAPGVALNASGTASDVISGSAGVAAFAVPGAVLGAVGTAGMPLAPLLVSAAIDSTGLALTLTFDKPVTFGAGGNGGLTVDASDGAATAAYESGDGADVLVYSLSRVIGSHETVTLSYVQPGDGIEDTSGIDLDSFSDTEPANQSLQDTLAPTVTSATTNQAGTQLRINHSEAVEFGAGGNGGFALTASGGAATLTYASGAGSSTLVYDISRPIAAGETLSLAYTQPGDGVVDLAGNELASFSGKNSNNNVGSGPRGGGGRWPVHIPPQHLK